MRLLVTVLILITSTLSAQESKQEAKLKEELNTEAAVEISFRNPTPPIAHLVLKAVETGARAGLKTVAYSVSVSGLPQDKTYILMYWDIGTPAPRISLQGVRIDENGTLRCGSKAKDCPTGHAGDHLVLVVSAMLGQPRRFVLTGGDKKPLAVGEAMPFPAIGKDNPCTLEAVILRPTASATLLIGEGFVPGEEVKYTSSSRGESLNGSAKADENGRALSLVLPFVKGYGDGQTSYTFNGSKCHPSTAFNWGAYREVQDTPAAQ